MLADKAFTAVVDKYLAGPKLPLDPLTKSFLKRCQSFSVKVGDKVRRYYRTGNGPAVVLVHGVQSNLGSMLPIASGLVEAGFRVVLFDLPGHGETSEAEVDPIEVRETICKICRQVGQVRGLVGHSLGGMWELAAVRGGLETDTIVTIGAPATSRFLVDKFVAMNEVSNDHAQRLVTELERRFGNDLWREYSAREIVKDVQIPGLVIHGKNDDFVPPRHAEEIGANWRSSRVVLVDGVGHFDSALSREVRDLVTSHLKQALPER